MSFRIGDVLVNERADWGARPPRQIVRSAAPFGWTQHYEGAGIGDYPHASCAAKVRAIQSFHIDGRGWSDGAYNWLVCRHGVVYELRGLGVKSAANGTAAGNAAARAICGMWGQGDDVTVEARHASAVLGDWLHAEGDCGPSCNCHLDWKPTACPGSICAWVKAGADDPIKPAPPIPPENDMPSPAIARDSDGNQWTFARGVDGHLWTMRNGDGWVDRGGILTSGPGVVRYGERIDVFAAGGDRALYHTWLDPEADSLAGWEPLGGTVTSSPDVAVLGDRLDVVARGADGALWQIAWLGDHWTGWWSLGGRS